MAVSRYRRAAVSVAVNGMTTWRRCGIGVALGATLSSAPIRAQELRREIQDDIARTVPEGVARDLTQCKLQDAIWGGYDVRVHVTMGIDGLPYLFEMRAGEFRRLVDPQPMPGPARFERSGRVRAESAKDAFGRGLPFYISQTELLDSNRLAITLVSNPVVRVELATLFIVADQPGVEDLTSVTIPVESTPEAQRIVAVNDAFRGPVLVRIAVLRDVGNTALMAGCVLSNEVDVRPAL